MIQVLMNLCINAIESMKDRGAIHIRARNLQLPGKGAEKALALAEGPYVRVSVEDDGAGMEPGVREHIFEPFYSTKREGRGLGLAAVHGIVRGHGGDILVTSKVGQGTRFDVYLPATEERTSPRDEAVEASLRGTETVLVIDDEPAILVVITGILENYGYKVLTANSGKAALQMIQESVEEIHAAILDLGMPIMSGKETFARLGESRPNMKILICSGYDRSGDAVELLEAGACSFVSKPFVQEELVTPLRAALDNQGQSGSGSS
jgi:CheY-like chemotaxis protein